SNSLPRTMRRKAAISGSTSTKSNSNVFGFTVPSLRARLLPCVRVTVLNFGPAMAALLSKNDIWDDRVCPVYDKGARHVERACLRAAGAFWKTRTCVGECPHLIRARSERNFPMFASALWRRPLHEREGDLETADHVAGRIPVFGFVGRDFDETQVWI